MSYYSQTQTCTVHRGTIEKGNKVHYCPSCGITYYETYFNQVIKKDGCWNCGEGEESEIDKEWKIEQVVEPKKIDKLESSSTKK